jgi:alpha-glucosidase
VDRQEGVDGSTLELYRLLLQLRREYGLGAGEVKWQPSGSPDVLVFDNGRVRAVINLGMQAAALPAGHMMVSSEPLDVKGQLPANTAAWLSLP